MNDDWYNSSFQIYALLNSTGNATSISSKIKNVLYEHTKDATKAFTVFVSNAAMAFI